MDDLSKVLVIIVTYNGEFFIKDCLSSIIIQDDCLDIMVVDNCSTDNTVKIVKEFFPKVKLVLSNTNLGFGKANNIGLEYGLINSYDYFFLLNQDTVVSENLIFELKSMYEKESIFGILSPIHLNGAGDDLDIHFEYFIKIQKKSRIISKLFTDKFFHLDKVFEVGFINAAAWFLSKEVVLSVGFFNPIFPHYGEDSDFFNRLRYHKGKSYVFTGGYIRHYTVHSYIQEIDFSKIYKRQLVEDMANLLDINHRFLYLFSSLLLRRLKYMIYSCLYFKPNNFILNFRLCASIIVYSLKFFILRREAIKIGAFIKYK